MIGKLPVSVGVPESVPLVNVMPFGNVPLKVFRVGRDGREVASTYATTAMGSFKQGTASVRLPAGTYELRAYEDSGEDRPMAVLDTKTFTVR